MEEKKSKSELPTVSYQIKKKFDKKLLLLIVAIIIVLIISICYILKKPTVSFTGEKNVKITYASEFDGNDITVENHGKDITDRVKIFSNVDTSKLGEQTIIYEIPYLVGYYKYERKVTVIDSVNPEIALKGETEEKVSYTAEYQEEGYTATDNYDGDITDKVEVNKEEINETKFIIHYKVSDSSGNKAEVDRTINYIDDIKPKIELVGNGTIVLKTGDQYNEQGATAVDEKDGDLTDKIQILNKVETDKEGVYQVTYTVSDNSSNQATAVRQVIVGSVGESAMNKGAPGTIYLTFDDGPSESITPHLLDILKEKGVHATFFVLNYGESKEYLIKRIVNEGHSIGIHGGSHEYSVVYSDPNSYLNDLDMMKAKIKATTGVETHIIRFPGGSSNTVSRKYYPGIMTILTTEVLARGYKYYDWNVASGDSGGANTSEEVYHNVTTSLKKERANMVLMHDFSGNKKTLNAVPDIIDYAKSQGYQFETITDKTPMITQRVAN